MNRNKKGFSLVELMVVIAIIAIIAILAAVAIPIYSDWVLKTEVSAELTDIGNIKSDITQVLMTNHRTTTMSTNIHDIETPTYVTLSDKW